MSDVPALTPVPSGETRGWTLEVDGRELDCGTMSLSSSWGVLSYGRHPRGYDTWWFAERGGGGSITLPFCYVDEVLYVGLIEEDRPNMGGPVLCAIGGFLDPGDDHTGAAERELREESGLRGSLTELPGPPLNPNRGFFVTDATRREGVHCYALEVARSSLVAARRGMRWDAPRGAEVVEVHFLPWPEAVRATADGIAVAAMARLFAWRSGLEATR